MKQPALRTSRRSFLKSTGGAALAAVAAPMVIPARAFGANDRLNIGLLGCGGRSGQLLPSILQAGQNVVAICDVDSSRFDRLKNAARKSPVGAEMIEKAKVYDDYRKLLASEKGVDAVVVASGQRWHVAMSKAALLVGKHVFCEKPLAHSAAECREIRELGKQTKLATQVGSQGGTSDSFRRSMELMQAGVLGQIREVHCWITRGFAPSAAIDTSADPIPETLNWDAWCGPSQLLPFKKYYLGGCLAWGRWLEFGDGHLADMGAHGLNLPWRALKLGAPIKCTVTSGEPVKDSYPSSNTFRWDFAARPGMDPVSVYWHDGAKAGPPEEHGKLLLTTYEKVPSDGCLFVGEKGILRSNAWGVGGVMRLKEDAKCRGVMDHEAGKSVAVTVPRQKGQNHMEEWLDAARGRTTTFQPFSTAANVAEIAMVGIIALRLGKPIEWDTENLKVKGMPEADPLIHRPQRNKWL